MLKESSAPQPDEQNETLIDGLLNREFGVVADFIEPDLVAGLRANLFRNLEGGRMHPAGIGKHFNFTQNLKIRGDLICWIDNESEDPFEKAFINRVRGFVDYLNRTCYTGINDFEFHYACYEEGSFYKRHRDQFKTDHGRKFSLVTYLNEDWVESDEGNLIIYTDREETRILPVGGKSVFIRSDETEHEVLPANRMRISIAGWLKRV